MTTSHLWLILDEKSKHQESEILMPKNWIWDKTDESFSALLESICEVDKVFRESKDTFLKQCNEIVKLQHQNNKNDCVDKILFNTEAVATDKLCMDCGCHLTFRSCGNCGNNKLTKETVETCTFEAGRVNAELHPCSNFTDYDTLLANIQCMIGKPDLENTNLLLKLFKKLELRWVFHSIGDST